MYYTANAGQGGMLHPLYLYSDESIHFAAKGRQLSERLMIISIFRLFAWLSYEKSAVYDLISGIHFYLFV